jgi:hypothetical protein
MDDADRDALALIIAVAEHNTAAIVAILDSYDDRPEARMNLILSLAAEAREAHTLTMAYDRTLTPDDRATALADDRLRAAVAESMRETLRDSW